MKLEELYKADTSISIGGYFLKRLPSPYQKPSIDVGQFIVTPNHYNANIPANIELVAGINQSSCNLTQYQPYL